MLRILQQIILTAVFAVFASQASAMFISPDPMNLTHPGVGTNRYAYSHGDPINMSDPSGLATTFHKDGSVTHWDPDSPEHVAIASGGAAGAQFMHDRMRSYNSWRSDFVSRNSGSHTFRFGESGLGGGFSLAYDAGTNGLPSDPIHQGIQNRIITDLTVSLAVGLAASYAHPDSHRRRTVAVLGGIGLQQSGFVAAVSGPNSLDPSQRGYLRGQERAFGHNGTALGGFGIFDASGVSSSFHAEHKVLTYSHRHSINPLALVASRPFCGTCTSRIQASGGTVSPVMRTGPITGFQGATLW